MIRHQLPAPTSRLRPALDDLVGARALHLAGGFHVASGTGAERRSGP